MRLRLEIGSWVSEFYLGKGVTEEEATEVVEEVEEENWRLAYGSTGPHQEVAPQFGFYNEGD